MNTNISILDQLGERISEAINDMDINIPDNITNKTLAYKVLRSLAKPKQVSKIEGFIKERRPSLIEPDKEYLIEQLVTASNGHIFPNYYKVNSIPESSVLSMARHMLVIGTHPTTVNVYDSNLTNIFTITTSGVIVDYSKS